jgi:hypothetical protein
MLEALNDQVAQCGAALGSKHLGTTKERIRQFDGSFHTAVNMVLRDGGVKQMGQGFGAKEKGRVNCWQVAENNEQGGHGIVCAVGGGGRSHFGGAFAFRVAGAAPKLLPGALT